MISVFVEIISVLLPYSLIKIEKIKLHTIY